MDLDRLFRQILKPALGCTEPVAVALASAAACQAVYGWTRKGKGRVRVILPERIRAIRVQLSKSIFKNGFAIAIPNTNGRKGLLVSAAVGVFCDPRKELRILAGLHPDHVARAEHIIGENRVHVEIEDAAGSGVYIKTEIEFEHSSGACLIFGEHSNIACLWRNGHVIDGDPDCEQLGPDHCVELEQLKALSFRELLGLIDGLPGSVIALLQETKTKNLNACQMGLVRPMGLGAGYFGAGNKAPRNYIQHLSNLTAAGSDVRMSGYPVEIMSSGDPGTRESRPPSRLWSMPTHTLLTRLGR